MIADIFDIVKPTKDKDDNDNDNYIPPKEFRTIYKATYKQPLKRMWRIIYDDGRLPVEERETFLEEYTLKGKTDFNCTDWESPDKKQHTDVYHPDNIKPGWKRNISYIMDINSPIGPKHTRTSAEEEIRIFEPYKVIFQSTSSTPDVPYGSSFNTIIIQCLFEDEKTHETSFEVYGFIRWIKGCAIKKSIENFAFNGMIDHQKEMDEELNKYIKANPEPKYTEDLISFSSPALSYSEFELFENKSRNDQNLNSFIPINVYNDNCTSNKSCNESYNKLLQDLINNKDMTTLNNNLVYDNILEIKEKELEKNNYSKNIYCSSLANTFNSSYVNYSERSINEEKIMKLKRKTYKYSLRNSKWIIISALMIMIIFVFTFNKYYLNNQTQ